MFEKAVGKARVEINAAYPLYDAVRWQPKWTITKYADQDAYARGESYETISITHNLLLNEGINAAWTLICGGGGTAFTNAAAYIGVGDDATGAAATQTGLQAAVNKLYKAMDVSYPTYGTLQKATWRSTFLAAEANFAWNEITVANGNSDASTNLNRLVQAVGTKASPGVWTVSLEITLS